MAGGGPGGVAVPSGESLRLLPDGSQGWQIVALPGEAGDIRGVALTSSAGILVPGAADVNPSGRGSTGAIWVSSDGTSWSRAEIDEPGGHIFQILRLGTGYVAIGGDEQICRVCLGALRRLRPVTWQSSDGLSWHRTDGPLATLGDDYGFDLAFSGDGRRIVATTVVAGHLRAVATVDGATWTRLAIESDPRIEPGDDVASWITGTPGVLGLVGPGSIRFGGVEEPRLWLATSQFTVTTTN
jgi:hypothetical protein